MSNARKGTKITPIVTVVFYTGETPWDGPHSLWDMMDVEDPLKSFVPNYPLYVIDMGHDMELHFSNRYLAELHELLSAIYANTADENQTIINNSIISLAGILANDSNLYQSANQSTEEEMKMCEALEKRDAIKFAELNAKCEATIAEKDAENAAALAEKDAEISEKDAEIARLKELLAAANQ